MFELLKSELRYNLKHWFPAIGLIILFSYLQTVVEDIAILVSMCAFVIVNNIYTFTSKENRKRLYLLLPLEPKLAALVRILLLVIPFVIFIALHVYVQFLLDPEGVPRYNNSIILIGIFLIIYSCVFIVKDVLADYFVSKGLNAKKLLMIALMSMVFLNLITVIIFVTSTKDGKGPFIDLIHAMKDIINSGYFSFSMILLGITLSIVTLFTFQNRKLI